MKRDDVLLLVENLRKLCIIVGGIADVMEKLTPSEDIVTVDAVEDKKAEPKKLTATKKKAKAEPVKEEPAAATEEAKAYTKEEVRQILADKSRKGYGPQVKSIINAHGADNLTGLDPSVYAAVIAEAEALDA